MLDGDIEEATRVGRLTGGLSLVWQSEETGNGRGSRSSEVGPVPEHEVMVEPALAESGQKQKLTWRIAKDIVVSYFMIRQPRRPCRTILITSSSSIKPFDWSACAEKSRGRTWLWCDRNQVTRFENGSSIVRRHYVRCYCPAHTLLELPGRSSCRKYSH